MRSAREQSSTARVMSAGIKQAQVASARYLSSLPTIEEAKDPDGVGLVSDHAFIYSDELASYNVAFAPGGLGSGYDRAGGKESEKEKAARAHRTLTQISNAVKREERITLIPIGIIGLQETEEFKAYLDSALQSANRKEAKTKEMKYPGLKGFKCTEYGVGPAGQKDRLTTLYDSTRYEARISIDYNGRMAEWDRKMGEAKNIENNAKRIQQREKPGRPLTAEEKEEISGYKTKAQKLRTEAERLKASVPPSIVEAMENGLLKGHRVTLFYDKEEDTFIIHHNVYLAHKTCSALHNKLARDLLRDGPIPDEISRLIPEGAQFKVVLGGDLNMRTNHPDAAYGVTAVASSETRGGRTQGCDSPDAIYTTYRTMAVAGVIEQAKVRTLDAQGRVMPRAKPPKLPETMKDETMRQQPRACISDVDIAERDKFKKAKGFKPETFSHLEESGICISLSGDMYDKFSHTLCLECECDRYDPNNPNDSMKLMELIQKYVKENQTAMEGIKIQESSDKPSHRAMFISIETSNLAAVQAIQQAITLDQQLRHDRIKLFKRLLNNDDIDFNEEEQKLLNEEKAFLGTLSDKSELQIEKAIVERVAKHPGTALSEMWRIAKEVNDVSKKWESPQEKEHQVLKRIEAIHQAAALDKELRHSRIELFNKLLKNNGIDLNEKEQKLLDEAKFYFDRFSDQSDLQIEKAIAERVAKHPGTALSEIWRIAKEVNDVSKKWDHPYEQHREILIQMYILDLQKGKKGTMNDDSKIWPRALQTTGIVQGLDSLGRVKVKNAIAALKDKEKATPERFDAAIDRSLSKETGRMTILAKAIGIDKKMVASYKSTRPTQKSSQPSKPAIKEDQQSKARV